MNPVALGGGEPRRTHPLSFAVKASQVLPQLVVPLGFAGYSIIGSDYSGLAAKLALGALVAIAAILLPSFLQWRRFTYRVGENDIRVESGVLSRAARSVPYERIQDVSLEQKLVPRLLGLVQVKFETGAGGKEELALSWLSQAEGEALRELVRERREEGEASPIADAEAKPQENAELLFHMPPPRLLKFGLFEFSLAVFAVLGGLAQYAETFLNIEVWDPDIYLDWFAGPGHWLLELGLVAQVIGVFAGLATLVLIGLVTGVVRTVLRDWDFRLERTAKGFRRRRGLLTRTDVVMPAHRVQALEIGTGIVRRRWCWSGLKFVSLAQDAGSSSHVVAPFAQDSELEPIIRAAGFHPPDEGLDWQHRTRAYRNASMLIDGGTLGLLSVILLVLSQVLVDSEAFNGRWYMALIPAAFGLALAVRQYFLWRHDRNAFDESQVYRHHGWLSPNTRIASRVKLQSVEIKQGPLGHRLGYASLHLGLAGGSFAINGIPLQRARELRRAVLDSISGTDFSELAG
ncbi:PH domain-containing protein [Erythrobacter sp. SDW2]|uniref:PH domain-containing protein n=1 Tax=Erythrobacter sp. SDW2 TaxID=2907154 RepID=UPI001F32DC5C|nr:PH domain-containing protein [Erythrobacter sp. SDW2]UIP07417.1 PH domain-containing protein [Erythrobacter sp. SDW2]